MPRNAASASPENFLPPTTQFVRLSKDPAIPLFETRLHMWYCNRSTLSSTVPSLPVVVLFSDRYPCAPFPLERRTRASPANSKSNVPLRSANRGQNVHSRTFLNQSMSRKRGQPMGAPRCKEACGPKAIRRTTSLSIFFSPGWTGLIDASCVALPCVFRYSTKKSDNDSQDL